MLKIADERAGESIYTLHGRLLCVAMPRIGFGYL
jgi:hypothetical protein